MKSINDFIKEGLADTFMSGGSAVSSGGAQPTGDDATKPKVNEIDESRGLGTGIADITGVTAKTPKIHEAINPSKLPKYVMALEKTIELLGDANVKAAARGASVNTTQYAIALDVISSIYEALADL